MMSIVFSFGSTEGLSVKKLCDIQRWDIAWGVSKDSVYLTIIVDDN